MRYKESVMEITLFTEMDIFVVADLSNPAGGGSAGEVGGGGTPDD